MEIVKEIDRKFEGYFTLLDYHISHCQLLIRCTTTTEDSWSNLDILFEGVDYIELSNSFEDIHLQNGSEDDWAYIATRCNEIYRQFYQLYKITSEGKTFYILAVQIRISTNSLLGLQSSIIK